MRLKFTKEHREFWRTRKINWATHYGNWDHPHRFLITKILCQFGWLSLMELGCGAGANLANIVRKIQNRQLGGVDINQDAIKEASKVLTGAFLRVGSVEDLPMSDKATDVILSDMCLIYVDPFKIGKENKGIRRVARNNVVLCEFHSESWYDRMKLRISSGYNSYNYKKLLEKYGFYDIQMLKLTEKDWPGGNPQKTFAYIIKATVPKRNYY